MKILKAFIQLWRKYKGFFFVWIFLHLNTNRYNSAISIKIEKSLLTYWFFFKYNFFFLIIIIQTYYIINNLFSMQNPVATEYFYLFIEKIVV